MATYHMRADGTAGTKAAADGTGGASTFMDVWRHNNETFSAGDIIVIHDGGGKYQGGSTMLPPSSGASGNHIIYQAAAGDTPIFAGSWDLTSSTYRWTESPAQSGEYYCELAAGGDPSLPTPQDMFLDGGRLAEGTVGSLADLEWDWGNNDSLGFNTVYIRDDTGGDPDSGSLVEASVQQYAFDIGTGASIAEHLTFDGLTFEHGYDKCMRLYNTGAGTLTGYHFIDCHWRRGKSFGVFLQGTSGNRITDISFTNCTAYENGGSGIGTGPYTDDIYCGYCDAWNNVQLPVSGGDRDYTAGIRFVTSPDAHAQTIYGLTVEYCASWSNRKTLAGATIDANGTVNAGVGIWLDTVGNNSGPNPCIVRYCDTWDNALEGLYNENNDGVSWSYCKTYDNGASGMRSECSYTSAPVENCTIYNITSYGNAGNGIQCAGYYTYTAASTYTDNIVANCIFHGNTLREIALLNGAKNVNNVNGRGSGNEYNNNCVGPAASNFLGTDNGVYHSTLSSFESAVNSPGAANNVDEDPLFVNAASGNFMLQSGSPCINAGTEVSLSRDYFGSSISGNPDIGIYEWVGPTGVPGTWVLTFQDAFPGTAIDTNKWKLEMPWGPDVDINNEIHYYDPDEGDYVAQNDGLRITTDDVTANGKDYQSGVISTEGLFSQSYGFFEVKARLPNSDPGILPQIWLYPESNTWPHDGEIDIMEAPFEKTDFYMTNHWYDGGNQGEGYKWADGIDKSLAYHTYAVHWTANYIRWYYDGQLVAQQINSDEVTPNAASTDPYGGKHFIINNAVGGGWPGAPDGGTTFPCYFDIEYVRAWTGSATDEPTNFFEFGAEDDDVQDYELAVSASGNTISKVSSPTPDSGTKCFEMAFAGTSADCYIIRQGGADKAYRTFHFAIGRSSDYAAPQWASLNVAALYGPNTTAGDGDLYGRLRIYNNGGTYELYAEKWFGGYSGGESMLTMNADTWYDVEWRFLQDASAGYLEWWVDGTKEYEHTGLNSSAAPADRLLLGGHAGGSIPSSGSIYFDTAFSPFGVDSFPINKRFTGLVQFSGVNRIIIY